MLRCIFPPHPQPFADAAGETVIGMSHPHRHRSALASLSNQQAIAAALGWRRKNKEQQELWFKALVSLFTKLGISFVSVGQGNLHSRVLRKPKCLTDITAGTLKSSRLDN